MRLIYVPLEKYAERYTEYQSGVGGVIETQAKALGVEVITIQPHNDLHRIKTGVVLDPLVRSRWAFHQTLDLIGGITNGEIQANRDVIFFEDFWHPGMEMIPYAKSLANNPVKMYAFNYAQSLDEHDFTYQMKDWIDHFEMAWEHCLDGIFCADKILEDRMRLHWDLIGPTEFYTVGLPFDSSIVKRIACGTKPRIIKREKQVVFSSRWDKEKCPEFFCALAHNVITQRDDVNFVVCSSAQELRSNAPELLKLANETVKMHPGRFIIKTGLTKQLYYHELARSTVQFNCSDQDWVSYTLLEATTFGCLPLYPRWLGFPQVLDHVYEFLYDKNNLAHAQEQLGMLFALSERKLKVDWIYKKYEPTVHRMLYHMGFDVPKPERLEP